MKTKPLPQSQANMSAFQAVSATLRVGQAEVARSDRSRARKRPPSSASRSSSGDFGKQRRPHCLCSAVGVVVILAAFGVSLARARQTTALAAPRLSPPYSSALLRLATPISPADTLKYHFKRQAKIDNTSIGFTLDPPVAYAEQRQSQLQLETREASSKEAFVSTNDCDPTNASSAEMASKTDAEKCEKFVIDTALANGGEFTSPNFPDLYPPNLSCVKKIEAPVNNIVVLEFRDDFKIEESTNCENDRIEIGNGPEGYLEYDNLTRYCGYKFPQEVRSSGRVMWLRFISDSSITCRGFKAVYRFESQENARPNPPSSCRFLKPNLTDNNVTDDRPRDTVYSGVIRHEEISKELFNYSQNFKTPLDCIWTITVKPGWKIYLTFSNYELGRPNDCNANFIEIYGENFTMPNETTKFCGTRTEPQQSKSNVYNVRHRSTTMENPSKFEIIYTAFREKSPPDKDGKNKDAQCLPGEFDCDDGTCIHGTLTCNQQVNCKYRYDEASDPGPCVGNVEKSFFETDHMLIILIVFLTLVSGMCASIFVSCWGKIQERRRRKQEYHMRKSREASMEGQLNKVDQVMYGTADSRANAANNPRQRIAASVVPSENHIQQANNGSQRYLSPEALRQQQQELVSGVHYQHPLMNPQMLADGDIGNYGVYNADPIMASNTSLDMKADIGKDDVTAVKHPNMFGSRSRVHDYAPEVNKSLQNVKQSILATMAAQKGQQQVDLNQQQSVPDVSFNNQFKIQTGVSGNNQQIAPMTNESLAHDTQQMLNLSLARQQQQKLISSIYQQQQHKLPLDNISNNNNSSSNSNSLIASQYGRLLRHQQNVGGINGIPGGILNQSAAAQNVPISLTKYNAMFQNAGAPQAEQAAAGHHQLNYDTNARPQFAAYNQQRALTMSTVHQPMFNNQQRNLQSIYGISQQQGHPLAANHLSNSITCCNVLGDCMAETPLVGDLVARANQQRMQYPQNNRIYELRSATIGPRMPNTAIPRSISAHQLSRSQMRQSQTQQQQQQQHATHQVPFKSMSDAGQVVRHQQPNHSLSYPHACTGHVNDVHPQQHRGKHSPVLPPPPPPPNLVQVRSSTACGSLPVAGNRQIDSRRAAFKVSRLDASQLTGDTIQDAEMIVGNMPLSSIQFDEPSSESDANFGMLMNSIGNASINLGGVSGVGSQIKPGSSQQQLRQQPSITQMGQQQQHPLFIGQPGMKQGFQPQARLLPHLSECNLIRRQRAGMVNRQDAMSTQPLVCDCGALERANQMRQQQHHHLQQVGSSHEFDDSDDGPCLMQTSLRPGSFEANNVILAQNVGHLKNPHSNLGENLVYGRQQEQQQYRFRQQSSEMTGEDEDDEDDDDEEIDGYNIEPDDEISSDAIPDGHLGDMKMEFRSRSVIRNEELRDGPGRVMSGSHTSISCQSCTCGSQLQLDQAGVEEESSNSKSGDTTNQATAIDNRAPIQNSVLASEKVAYGSTTAKQQRENSTSAGLIQSGGEKAKVGREGGDNSSKSTDICDNNNSNTNNVIAGGPSSTSTSISNSNSNSNNNNNNNNNNNSTSKTQILNTTN